MGLSLHGRLATYCAVEYARRVGSVCVAAEPQLTRCPEHPHIHGIHVREIYPWRAMQRGSNFAGTCQYLLLLEQGMSWLAVSVGSNPVVCPIAVSRVVLSDAQTNNVCRSGTYRYSLRSTAICGLRSGDCGLWWDNECRSKSKNLCVLRCAPGTYCSAIACQPY